MKIFDRREFLKKSIMATGGLGGAFAALSGLSPRTLEGRAETGETEEDLVTRLDKVRTTHPRLHFNAPGLKALRSRAASSHSRYAELLFEWVERNKNFSPKKLLSASADEVALEQCGAFVTNAALAYMVSGREKYLEQARKWAMEMCEYNHEDADNYGFGIYTAGLARAYDWLYGDLSPAERGKIRATIADIVRKLYQGSFPGATGEFWWAEAYIHHDHWIPVGGYGEAALALLGETEEASRWAARAKADFDYAFSWLGEDGAWHEGVADWCYTMAPLLWFFGAWQSVLGENPHDVPWIRNTAFFRLYHWLPDDSYVYLNDSFRSGRYSTSGSASCHLMRRLASLFQDGYAQWLAGRDEAFDFKSGAKGVYQAPYEGLSYTGRPTEYPYPDSQCAAWNLLWYDPQVKPLPPDTLPRARLFDNQGVAILRSGWDKESAVASLSSAPLAGRRAAERIRSGEKFSPSNYGHAQANYSAFTLFARGQYFIIPPGYARRSSGFQNVVSVNGADFQIDPSLDLSILALRTQEDFSYAAAEASQAFPPEAGVQEYRRHLFLFQAGWMILYDDLKLNDQGKKGRSYNRFTWSVHSDPSTHLLAVSENRATWKKKEGNAPGLNLFILEPEAFAWERALLQSTDKINMLEALRLIRPEWNASGMRVFSAWSWQDAPEAPEIIRHKDFLVLFWKNDPSLPAVGFAISKIFHPEISHPDLTNRRLLLFGHDPNNPDSFLEIISGKVK